MKSLTFILLSAFSLVFGAGCQTAFLQSLMGPDTDTAPDPQAVLAGYETPTESNAGSSRTLVQRIFGPKDTGDDDKISATLRIAVTADRDNRLDDAKSLYRQILKYNPDHALAHHRLAVIGDRQRNYRASEFHYEKALEKREPSANLLSDIGYSFLVQKRYRKSEVALNAALRKDPQHAAAAANLKRLYAEQGEHETPRRIAESTGRNPQRDRQHERLKAPDPDPNRNAVGYGTARTRYAGSGIIENVSQRKVAEDMESERRRSVLQRQRKDDQRPYSHRVGSRDRVAARPDVSGRDRNATTYYRARPTAESRMYREEDRVPVPERVTEPRRQPRDYSPRGEFGDHQINAELDRIDRTDPRGFADPRRPIRQPPTYVEPVPLRERERSTPTFNDSRRINLDSQESGSRRTEADYSRFDETGRRTTELTRLRREIGTTRPPVGDVRREAMRIAGTVGGNGTLFPPSDPEQYPDARRRQTMIDARRPSDDFDRSRSGNRVRPADIHRPRPATERDRPYDNFPRVDNVRNNRDFRINDEPRTQPGPLIIPRNSRRSPDARYDDRSLRSSGFSTLSPTSQRDALRR